MIVVAIRFLICLILTLLKFSVFLSKSYLPIVISNGHYVFTLAFMHPVTWFDVMVNAEDVIFVGRGVCGRVTFCMHCVIA